MEYFKDFLKSIDLSKMFNIPWLTDSYSKWVIIFIIWGLFWGITCRIIVSNKGYEGSWCAWGFIFGPIAFFLALAKPVYQPKYDSFSFNESMIFCKEDKTGNVQSVAEVILPIQELVVVDTISYHSSGQ